jgi:hypothetical protein
MTTRRDFIRLSAVGGGILASCRLAVERIVRKNPTKAKDLQVGFLALK